MESSNPGEGVQPQRRASKAGQGRPSKAGEVKWCVGPRAARSAPRVARCALRKWPPKTPLKDSAGPAGTLWHFARHWSGSVPRAGVGRAAPCEPLVRPDRDCKRYRLGTQRAATRSSAQPHPPAGPLLHYGRTNAAPRRQQPRAFVFTVQPA